MALCHGGPSQLKHLLSKGFFKMHPAPNRRSGTGHFLPEGLQCRCHSRGIVELTPTQPTQPEQEIKKRLRNPSSLEPWQNRGFSRSQMSMQKLNENSTEWPRSRDVGGHSVTAKASET